MVKVSIILPNNAQITFESEEPGVVEQVIKMVLHDLPRDLMGSTHLVDGGSSSDQDWEKSNSVVNTPFSGPASAEESVTPGIRDDPAEPDSLPAPAQPSPVPAEGSSALPTAPRKPPVIPLRETRQAGVSEAEEAFIEFCQAASPLGDMRMVVVAAEAASRLLSMDGVDAPTLERLFDLVGWRRPHSFIQTLRNAARSKFRWLERLPGRSGRYTVTDLGRATTLPE